LLPKKIGQCLKKIQSSPEIFFDPQLENHFGYLKTVATKVILVAIGFKTT
jgi:hypothetical protein